jgi:hypothetical protein
VLDEDDSDAEVPIESALEVLDSDVSSECSAVSRKGRRTNEEIVHGFWNEIGFPTPASRFLESSRRQAQVR